MILNSVGIGRRMGAQMLRSLRFNSKQLKELNWVEFLKLKKQNRYINMGFSCLTCVGGSLVTFGILGNLEFQVELKVMGIDYFTIMVVLLVAGGGLGYQFGPLLGNPVFRMTHRPILRQFQAKDQDFLKRIKAHRVDPSSQSFSNPVPDYYGEKIFSLKDYKQWLRDGNTFRRKAKEFV